MPESGAGSPPGAGLIRSAGAVVWRPGPDGLQVVVIHRPRYDDWSFPKGKQDPGEHLVSTAVREVLEETGAHVVLGRPLGRSRYESTGHPKTVHYWAAAVADPAAETEFTPNDEVDKLDWLPVAAARGRLSYQRDVNLLDRFTAGPAATVPVILLRHASAGHKHDWPGLDLARPLDGKGAADADALAPLLTAFGRCRVISSAAERCVATVRPYAALSGMAIEVEAGLSVPPGGGSAPERAGQAAAATMAAVARAGQPVLICAHRENLPDLIGACSAGLGAAPPEGRPLRKAAWWVLHAAGGQLVASERHQPGGS
jgi:8-oxo-dGTP diphosphatase